MNTYKLVFADDGKGEPKIVMFEAQDASRALIIAEGEATGRSAQLWRDDTLLCSLEYDERHVWHIDPHAS